MAGRPEQWDPTVQYEAVRALPADGRVYQPGMLVPAADWSTGRALLGLGMIRKRRDPMGQPVTVVTAAPAPSEPAAESTGRKGKRRGG